MRAMSRPRPIRAAVVVGVAALLLGAACGSDEGSDTADPTTTADTTGADDPTTTTEADGGDETGLEVALLTVDDLPEGFTGQDSPPLTDEGSDEGLCPGEGAGVLPDQIEEVGRDFENEAETILMGSQVTRFAGDDAATFVQQYRDEVARCATEDVTATISDIEGIGDEALSVVVGAPDDPYVSHLRVARVGDVVVFLGITGDAAGVLDGDALLATSVGRVPA